MPLTEMDFTSNQEEPVAQDQSVVQSPNVLVILTDQQRWDTVGAYGSPMNLTPNLDALADRGVRFEHAFTCQPVCGPARACLQTGRYASANGVWRNGIPLRPDDRTIAHAFRDQGYDVGYIGKWHLAATGREPVPRERRGGYEHWEAADALEHTSHPDAYRAYDADNQELVVPGYRVDAQTELVLRYLRQPREKPFFLFVSYLEPHQQNDYNRFVAPDGYAERYANPWVPGDLLDRPGDWFSQLPDYYGMCARIDECLGRILDELRARGQIDNTVVLFTSDHGCHFRSRNNEYKRSCHESSIRIPAVMAGPRVPAGRVVRDLVSLIDVPPTLLDAASIAVPAGMQGRSALPLARGEPVDWPEEVFVQISEAEVGRAIRTDRWTYAVYARDADPRREGSSVAYHERALYNLAADPHQRVNLIGRADHADVAARLRERLIDRMVQAGEPPPEIIPARFPAV